MRAPLAACCELMGSYNRLPEVLYVFEHKSQYLLIHAPSALWYSGILVTYPHRFRRVKFVIIPHVLYSSNISEILL